MTNNKVKLLLKCVDQNDPGRRLKYVHFNKEHSRLESTDTKRVVLIKNISSDVDKNVFFEKDMLKPLTLKKFNDFEVSIKNFGEISILVAKAEQSARICETTDDYYNFPNMERIRINEENSGSINTIHPRLRTDLGQLGFVWNDKYIADFLAAIDDESPIKIVYNSSDKSNADTNKPFTLISEDIEYIVMPIVL